MVEDVKNKIYQIALNTFELTCFMFPLEEWEAEELEKPSENEYLRAIVTFDGAAKGGLILTSSIDLVNAIASNMLGVEQATDSEKEGALCEIANIICGNLVPIFANNENICFVHPPRLIESGENTDALFSGMEHDHVSILLDEGSADISVYHSIRELI